MPNTSVSRRSGTPSPLERLFSVLNVRVIAFAIIAALILYLGTIWVINRFFTSDEDHVRAALTSAAEGACAKSPGRISQFIADDFVGPGGIDKDQLHAGLQYVLMTQFQIVEVKLVPTPVPVQMTDKAPAAAKRKPGQPPPEPEKFKVLKRAVATFKVEARGRQTENGMWENILTEHQQPSAINCYMKYTNEKGWQIERAEAATDEKQ